jgi:hypothetical protein
LFLSWYLGPEAGADKFLPFRLLMDESSLLFV